MSLSITGKTAIVTGAARGIGLAIAKHFLERGANVMCADCDEGALQTAWDDLPEQARLFAGDLSQKLAMANLVSATIDAFDRVDVLVNAQRAIATCDPLCTDEEVLDSMLRRNMMAGLRLSQLVARRMIGQEGGDERQAGAIVNVSGHLAGRSQPELLAYSISCAAQDQATRGLALALAGHRIRVNGVAFAGVMSDKLQLALREDPELRDELLEGTPLGRVAAADELAETVHYLVSGGAGFVTGQILTVDGGRGLYDPVQVPVY